MENIAIAVVMTVFNRKEKTQKCIDSIISENDDKHYQLAFFITNDGSTDGTHELINEYAENNPSIRFVEMIGSGNLYWNKGMHMAFQAALKEKFDYYLWVNNDVQFKKGFLPALITDYSIARQKEKMVLICGSVAYHGEEKLSYGGAVNLSKINPYKRKLIYPKGQIQKCQCINGNCLLIPEETATFIGNVDERYEHGFGDFDYGYRVIESGGQPFVASHYVGRCDRNSEKGTWKDSSVLFAKRIYLKNRPTGQPFYSHKLFLKKWFPTFWPYYLIRPYIGIALSSIKYKLVRK